MSKTLIIEFSTTTGCNLGCKYCYSSHINNKMSKNVADNFFNIIGDLMEIYKCDNYHISYFGGEPLLNWEIIEYTLPKFQNDERCKSKTIITNGLLLNNKNLDILKKYNCSISLSFDGIWSDINRPLNNGKGSLEYHLKNKELYNSLIKTCKVMVDQNCFKTMSENLEFFVDFGINNPDFSLVRDNIYTNNDIEIFSNEIRRLGDKILELNKIHKKYINVGFFELYLLDIIVATRFGKRGWGCFVGKHGAVYTTEGEFYPCERFRSNKKFNLFDGKIFNKENIEFLLNNEVSDPRYFIECQNCELYKFCNAQCTYSQLENSNFERSKPIENVCKLLKLIYNEAIRVFHLSDDNFKNSLIKRLENI